MSPLIGRKEQVAILQEALASADPEMVALIGRRRVGKTFLVRHVYAESLVFQLTGLQTGGLHEQLRNFALSFARAFPEEPLVASDTVDWLGAFDRLGRVLEARVESGSKPVVFLDELPWLGTKRSGFIRALGYFWNSYASRLPLVVVICGSAASWMIDRVINDKGGLHNRVTKLLYLQPFTLAETEAFCRAKGIQLPRYQILQVYLTMGGIPMYLNQLRPVLSAAQNIQAICFARDGYLRREFERLFASLFDNYEQHVAVVRALATKRIGLTKPDLARAAKLTTGGGLNRILSDLSESGFIAEYGGYGKKRRDRLFRLTDFYTLFYLTYIERLGPSTSPTDFQQLSNLPAWKSWTGYTFENVCLTHLPQIKRSLGIAGIATTTASFYARADEGGPGAQIDLLIERADQTIHLCEAKFTEEPLPVSTALLDTFRRKRSVFVRHSRTRAHLLNTLITTYAPTGNWAARGIDQVVTLDELFAD